MATPHVTSGPRFGQELRDLRSQWFWFLLFGIALVVLGIVAIGAAFLATMITVVAFAILLMIAGVLSIVGAFWVQKWSGFFLQLLGGILYLVIGLFMVRHPLAAAAGLTLMIAALLLAGGAVRIAIALTQRFESWGWMMVNGIVSVVLGFLIWMQWPEASMWLIGLFVGIDLLFHGWTWMMFALTLKSFRAPAE